MSHVDPGVVIVAFVALAMVAIAGIAAQIVRRRVAAVNSDTDVRAQIGALIRQNRALEQRLAAFEFDHIRGRAAADPQEKLQ